jgi:glyoxylase-like metal-dependent hydrolase (beta-lactamase superfamily II)
MPEALKPEFKLAVIPVTVFQQNCTILWDTKTRQCAVIDPGGEPGRITDLLNRMDLVPEIILLTHGHLDHAGGALALKGIIDPARAALGLSPVPVVGPDARDQFLLDSIEAQAAKFGIKGLRNITPDRFVTEGEVIELGSLRFQVLHVPGHTPGHVVFIDPAAKLALVGDVVFRQSVGRTDFEYGDGAALIRGIKEKLLPLGDDIAFICGHGEGSTLGAERRDNPFLQEETHS